MIRRVRIAIGLAEDQVVLPIGASESDIVPILFQPSVPRERQQLTSAAARTLDSRTSTFGELQQSATILIGAFNDAWTMRLSDVGRYGFEHDGTKYWIIDRQNRGTRQWGIDLDNRDSQGKLNLNEEFAIISWVLNERTGKMLVTVGSLYGFGIQAAGQFLTDPK